MNYARLATNQLITPIIRKIFFNYADKMTSQLRKIRGLNIWRLGGYSSLHLESTLSFGPLTSMDAD
jgi:hypothetical protein